MRTTITLAVMLAVAVSGGVFGQGYRVDWCSINSGGGACGSASYGVNHTIGQPAAGFEANMNLLHWVGFWAGGVPNPTVVPSIGGARMLADGTFVSIAGKIATSAETDFADFFYIEESDRVNGIRIAVPAGPVAGLARGSVVNVIGTLGTTLAGERQLTGPIVIVVDTDDPLAPMGMPNRSVGGGTIGSPPLGQYGVLGGTGLNNVGLLVTTWGRVTATGSGYAVIDDGSGTPVRLDTSTLADPPEEDDYISVIGISSLYKPGVDRLRLVLPRTDLDISGY